MSTGSSYLAAGHTSVELVDTDTAAEDSPAVHTAAAGTAVLGMTAVWDTEVEAGTAAVEDKPEAAVVDNRLLEVEDKPEAVENRTVEDTAFDHELAVHIQRYMAAAVLKLQNIHKRNIQLTYNEKSQHLSLKNSVSRLSCFLALIRTFLYNLIIFFSGIPCGPCNN